jgi:pantothenate synthetase
MMWLLSAFVNQRNSTTAKDPKYPRTLCERTELWKTVSDDYQFMHPTVEDIYGNDVPDISIWGLE